MNYLYNPDMYDGESGPSGLSNQEYWPITPCLDNKELAKKGRLMIRHGVYTNRHSGYPLFFWAEPGAVQIGWVVGVEL